MSQLLEANRLNAVDFLSRYRRAVTGLSDAPLVFLGNFEVENAWAEGERGLPRQFNAGQAQARSMDELAVLLAGPGDHVLLSSAPDPDFLGWLQSLRIALPTVHASADTVQGPEGAFLAPHGISAAEEALADTLGIPLAGPGATVCKAVNSKVYSRRLADRLGLRQPPGIACSDVDELDRAIAWGVEALSSGQAVVVKDAYGVSGKGIVVVTPADGPRRLERLGSLVTRSLRGSDDQSLGIVVEHWVAKATDLSCQLTVSRDGEVRLDFVKEAVIVAGVPQGHRIPARLSSAQEAELVRSGGAIAEALAADGYFGVVGIDAMTDPSGGVYPIVEVNARHNLGTYQAGLLERFLPPGQAALARVHPVRPAAGRSFADLAALLDGLLYDVQRGKGLLISAFAPVEHGRLYAIVVADTAEQAVDLDAAVTERLALL